MKAEDTTKNVSIFVSFSGLNSEVAVTDELLRNVFSLYGDIEDVAIRLTVHDKDTNVQKGYAFVCFKNTAEGIEAAFAATNELNDKIIDDVHYYKVEISRQLTNYLKRLEEEKEEQAKKQEQLLLERARLAPSPIMINIPAAEPSRLRPPFELQPLSIGNNAFDSSQRSGLTSPMSINSAANSISANSSVKSTTSWHPSTYDDRSLTHAYAGNEGYTSGVASTASDSSYGRQLRMTTPSPYLSADGHNMSSLPPLPPQQSPPQFPSPSILNQSPSFSIPPPIFIPNGSSQAPPQQQNSSIPIPGRISIPTGSQSCSSNNIPIPAPLFIPNSQPSNSSGLNLPPPINTSGQGLSQYASSIPIPSALSIPTQQPPSYSQQPSSHPMHHSSIPTSPLNRNKAFSPRNYQPPVTQHVMPFSGPTATAVNQFSSSSKPPSPRVSLMHANANNNSMNQYAHSSQPPPPQFSAYAPSNNCVGIGMNDGNNGLGGFNRPPSLTISTAPPQPPSTPQQPQSYRLPSPTNSAYRNNNNNNPNSLYSNANNNNTYYTLHEHSGMLDTNLSCVSSISSVSNSPFSSQASSPRNSYLRYENEPQYGNNNGSAIYQSPILSPLPNNSSVSSAPLASPRLGMPPGFANLSISTNFTNHNNNNYHSNK